MTISSLLSTRRLVLLGTATALLAGGAAIRATLAPLAAGKLPG